MLNAPESKKIATPQPVPVSEPPIYGQGKSDSPPRMICDLAEGEAFVEFHRRPHVHYRQGDVLIERIAHIPTTAEKQNKSTRIILAHGEVTGHHHALETAGLADWWKTGEISIANQKPTELVGEMYVSLPAGGVVSHQEHSEIKLPAGFYRITRQREYFPEAIHNVND